MNSFGMVNAPFTYLNDPTMHDYCRICGNINSTFTLIFEDDGNLLDIGYKINEYLPITVRKTDFLPLKVCSDCEQTLLRFHNLYITCQTTNAKFLNMLGYESQDPTYSYDAVKQITNDATELLESAFSREIENEILQMHNAKYIENEIAAGAAATELERIGGSFAADDSFIGENGDDRDANNIVLMNLDQQTKPASANSHLVSNGHYEKLDETIRNKELNSSNLIQNSSSDQNGVNKNDKVTEENTYSNERKAVQKVRARDASPSINQSKQVGTTKEKNEAETTNSRSEVSKQKNSPRSKPKGLSPRSNKKDETKRRNVNSNTQKRNGTIETKEKSLQNADLEKKTVKSKKNSKDNIETSLELSEDRTPPSDAVKCDHCSSEFKDKTKMVEHLKSQHSDKIFLCEMCNEYVAIADLMTHMLNHALQVNNVTATTTAITTTPTQQEDSTSPNNKTESNKSETTPPEITNQNNDSSKENNLPKPKLPVNCTECDRKFADRTGLRYHINHFHNKVKNYECDLCGRYFSCKRIITNHLLGVHLREKRLKCDQCPKRFSTDSALYMHRKVHTDVLLFTCQICERKFRSLTKLKVHITTHTKEKNYFCEICNKGFAIRNNLTKHMHTHSKSFDFKCQKCDYAANQRRYLFEHIKRSHKD